MDEKYGQKADTGDRVPLLWSHRLTHAVLAFFGNLFIYCNRVNLSLAIICMVRNGVTSNTTSLGIDSATNGVSFNLASQDDMNGSTGKTFSPDVITTTIPATSQEDGGEFDWDKSMQAHLLSMYFYGYLLTQVPGGWLSSRYGGKRVWGFCQLIGAVATILTPVCARTHIYLACAVRFIIGFVSGVTFPSVHSLMGRWAPPLDRSRMVSVTFSGATTGTIMTFAVSGLLCEYGFDNGWGSIFYLCGMFNLVWVVVWFFVTADSPVQHKGISERERNYIQDAIGKGAVRANEKKAVPWLKIFTSGPMWAIVFASFSSNYFNYTLLTSLPMFLKEAMNFDIKQNGILSSLPFVAQFMGGTSAGYIADKVIAIGWFKVKTTRKIFQFASLVGAAVFFMALVQVDADQRYVAVILLCLCALVRGIYTGGYAVNHLDLAPRYAGLLFGITNTTATIPGIIAPLIAGALTPNKTAEEWRYVFYVCAAVCVAGALLYVLLADGELQTWASAEEESSQHHAHMLEKEALHNGGPESEHEQKETICLNNEIPPIEIV